MKRKRVRAAAFLAAAVMAVSLVHVGVLADDTQTDETTDTEDTDTESTETENTLTNEIDFTGRTVYQDGTEISYEVVDEVDTYTVTSKEGVTVSYENKMDMEILAATFLEKIQNYNSSITDAWGGASDLLLLDHGRYGYLS